MSDFESCNPHFQDMFIFFFHSKKPVAEGYRKFRNVYGDAALGEKTYRDWFRRFKYFDFDVDDRSREGSPNPSRMLSWRHC